ncbi:MAG: autotransporter domain-containing protein [Alphaproteobacteria bacterium]|nr:MAG: autotransporter domain-containing protein [Alphaproteobacteria bacterium]
MGMVNGPEDSAPLPGSVLRAGCGPKAGEMRTESRGNVKSGGRPAMFLRKYHHALLTGVSLACLGWAAAAPAVEAAPDPTSAASQKQAIFARKQASGRRQWHLNLNPSALNATIRSQDDYREARLFGRDVLIRPDIIIADSLGTPDSILDLTNQHPNVVGLAMFDLDTGLVLGFCSGTLINARTVISAAHCVRFDGTDPSFDKTIGVAVTTNPDGQEGFFVTGDFVTAAGHVVPVEYDRDAFFLGYDISVIALNDRITGITPAGLVGSAPAPGTLGTIVGFGTAGVGSDPNSQFLDLRRRVATNIIEAIDSFNPDFPDAQLFIDFEDPDNPGAFDFFGDPTTTDLEGTTAPGDSGGALLVQDADGNFLLAGVTSGGFNPFNQANSTFGDVAFFTNVAAMRPFIDAVNPLRQASAIGASGDWLDPAHWSEGLIPANFNALRDGGEPTLVSSFFEVTLGDGTSTTLGDPFAIEIDTLTLDGGDLDISGGALLQVVDFVDLANGTLQVQDSELDSGWLLIEGGSFTVGENAIYFDNSASIDLGTVMLGGSVKVDGIFATDFLDLRDGSFTVGATGQLLDFAGSAISGGTLDVNGEYDTAAYTQLGGTVTVGESGLLIDTSGVTAMMGGFLDVNGQFVTGAFGQSLGIVGGTGRIRAPLGFIQSGGLLAPGNSVGTLVLEGDYLQDVGGGLLIEVDETGADLLQVLPDASTGLGGNAQLDGVVVADFQPGFTPDRGATFRFIETSGTLTGTPTIVGGPVASDGTPTVMRVDDELIINDTGVVSGGMSAGYFQVFALDYTPFTDTAQQRAVASVLDSVTTPTSIERDSVRNIVGALDGLSVEGALQQALQTLNPTETFMFDRFGYQLSRLIGGRLARRATARRAGGFAALDTMAFISNPIRLASTSASDAARLARGLGNSAAPTPDGDGNKEKGGSPWSFFIASDVLTGNNVGVNARFGATDFLVTFGADRRFGDDYLIGIAADVGNFSTDATGRSHNGNAYGFNFYGSANHGPFYANGYVGVQFMDLSGNRPVLVGDTLNARAKTDGFLFVGGMDAGALVGWGPLEVGPLFQIRHTSLKIDAYGETGAGDFGATFASRKPDQTLLGIGGQLQFSLKDKKKRRWLHLYTSVTFQADVAPRSRFFTRAGFTADPALLFDVPGVAIDDHFGTVEGGLSVRLSRSASFDFSFESDFGRKLVEQRRFAGGFRFKF